MAMQKARETLALKEAEATRTAKRRRDTKRNAIEGETSTDEGHDAKAHASIEAAAGEMFDLVSSCKTMVAKELANSRVRERKATAMTKEVARQQNLGVSRIRAQVSVAKKSIKASVALARMCRAKQAKGKRQQKQNQVLKLRMHQKNLLPWF